MSKPPIPRKNPLFKLKKTDPRNPSKEKKIQTNAKSIKIFKGL